MTIRQLFQSISFDHLIPFIKESDQPNDIACYKQAYDILLHIVPDEEGCMDVDVHLNKNYDGTEYVTASQIEGDWWSTYIDGEIIIEDGIKITDEELAFKLLWHLTFYGYSPVEIRDTIHGMGNDEYHDNAYGRQARIIDHKRITQWANKAIKKRIKESLEFHSFEGMNEIFLSDEDWQYIDKRKRYCNRMKQMREHRLRLRQRQLANLDRCENTIQRLLKDQSSTTVTREDLGFLVKADCRIGTEFQTRAYDVTNRMIYLDELIKKYDVLDVVKEMGRAVLKIITSAYAPLTESEVNFLRKTMAQLSGRNDTILIVSENPSLENEIGIMVVGLPK